MRCRGASKQISFCVWQVCRKSMRQPSLSSHKLRGNKRAALSRPSALERVLGKGMGGLPDSSVCLPVWAFFYIRLRRSLRRSVALLLRCSAVLQVSLWIVCAGDTWQLKLKCRRHRCTYLLGSAHGLGFAGRLPFPPASSCFPFPTSRCSLKL